MSALEDILPDEWYRDVRTGCLVCPHDYMIEMDGRCPEGCVSPLREKGLI